MFKDAVYTLINKLLIQSQDYILKQQLRAKGIPTSVSVSRSDINGHVEIGEHTYIAPLSLVTSGENSKVVIGRHCAIGRYVSITSKGHDLTRPTSDENHESHKHVEADTIVGNYVWIGDHSFIKHGVTIGDYAVIGAGSTVVKDVEPFEIVGGVPAKHIRYNTSHYKYQATQT